MIDPASEVRRSISESQFLGGLEDARALLGGGRKLREDEIDKLKKAGNRTSDWKKVRVGEKEKVDPNRIQNCRFLGEVLLGSFKGETMLGDVSFPAGIYDSTLSDCVVCDEALVKDVGLMSRVVVRRRAVVASCGEVSCPHGCVFGNGAELSLAIETASRKVLTYAEITVPVAKAVACNGAEGNMLSAYAEAVKEYLARAKSDWMVVSEGARVANTQVVRGVFVGPHACIHGATLVENATILSNEDGQTKVVSGAYVSDALLQWNCQVGMLAIVKDSVVTKHSRIGRRYTLVDSVSGLGICALEP